MFWTIYSMLGLVAAGCVLTLGLENIKRDDEENRLDSFEITFLLFAAVVVAALAVLIWPAYFIIWRLYRKVRPA